MPVGFAPTKSAAHRLACRVLYKHLLTVCAEIRSDTASSSTLPTHLQSLVQYRFRHDRSLQSPRRIVAALEHGRKALHLLHEASTGSSKALSDLTSILKSVKEQMASLGTAKEHMSKDLGNYPAKALKKQEFTRQAADPSKHLPKPHAIPILSRPVPLSEIKSGKRFVPHYRVTQGIPFLRYGKPQPYSLSLFIRGAIRKNEKRWKLKQQMENMVQLGRDEDDWDQEIYERFGVSVQDAELGQDGSWGKEFHAAERAVFKTIKATDYALSARGEVLWNIALKEKALAEQEEEAAKQERNQATKKQSTSTDDSDVDKSFLGE